jgi:hypothetical protein
MDAEEIASLQNRGRGAAKYQTYLPAETAELPEEFGRKRGRSY